MLWRPGSKVMDARRGINVTLVLGLKARTTSNWTGHRYIIIMSITKGGIDMMRVREVGMESIALTRQPNKIAGVQRLCLGAGT